MPKKLKTGIARWVAGSHFEGISGSGHLVVMDSPAQGQKGKGATPMELLLLGVAGCSGIDVVDILKKKRQALTGLEIRVEGERAKEFPMVYTDIEVTYIVSGKDISEKAVKDAIHLSETKYCSASIMLGKTAKIKTKYEILPES